VTLVVGSIAYFLDVPQSVYFIADDPADDSSSEAIIATRGNIPYEALGDPRWWTISNLLFLYTSAVQRGGGAGNLWQKRDRYPELVRLTLAIAQNDTLGQAARAGAALPDALLPHAAAISQVATSAPRASSR
jgi:hypothetical protein